MKPQHDANKFQTFTGLRNDVDPMRFEPTDLAVASNVDIDKSGRIKRRDGYVRRITGASHSCWADNEFAFCVQGTALKRVWTDWSMTTVRDDLTPGARMAYCRVGERVYYSNGYQSGIYERGAGRSWGLPVPGYTGASVSNGLLGAGTYQVAVTFVDGDGQESGSCLPYAVQVDDDSSLSIYLPRTDDARVMAKNIYVSKPNGETLYLLDTVPADQAAYHYMVPVELTYELNTLLLQGPPAGHLLAYYKGRLFVAADDLLYYSEPLAYELFNHQRYIQLDGRVSLLAVLEEAATSGLFVASDKTTGILIGDDPDTFTYVPKLKYGAVLGAIDYVDGSLFLEGDTNAKPLPMWLSKEGICVGLPGMEIKNLTRTKYGFETAGEGAALFKSGQNQFIATSTS